MTKVVEMRKLVEARKREEQKKYGGGGGDDKISPQFVQYCLSANEMGDGLLFAELHRNKLVFNKSMDQWLQWAGHHWKIDKMGRALADVENLVDVYLKEAGRISEEMKKFFGNEAHKDRLRQLTSQHKKLVDRANRLRTTRGRRACLQFAHTCKEPLAIEGEEIDRDPWLLPCENGVVNLKTGAFNPGRPEDYMLKACSVEWQGIDVPCPKYESVLKEIFSGNHELIDFFQRLIGLSLVGKVIHSIFVVMTGSGRNGKSMLVEVFSEILGPLAGAIRSEMLLDQGRNGNSAGPTPDIMALRGRRLCFASETDDGCRISPSRVKWITGKDRLAGRNPHDKYEVEFRPTHTLFLLTNHKPHAPADDFAFWERMILIPFEVAFVDREPTPGTNEHRADPELPEKLRAELPGILAWMVRGALKWREKGALAPPPIVLAAVEDYRREEDIIADFVDACCVVGPDAWVGATQLYTVFEAWWKKNVSKNPPKQKRFGTLFGKRFERKKNGIIKYKGVGLLDGLDDLFQ